MILFLLLGALLIFIGPMVLAMLFSVIMQILGLFLQILIGYGVIALAIGGVIYLLSEGYTYFFG